MGWSISARRQQGARSERSYRRRALELHHRRHLVFLALPQTAITTNTRSCVGSASCEGYTWLRLRRSSGVGQRKYEFVEFPAGKPRLRQRFGKKTVESAQERRAWKKVVERTTPEFQNRARAVINQLQEAVKPADALQGCWWIASHPVTCESSCYSRLIGYGNRHGFPVTLNPGLNLEATV